MNCSNYLKNGFDQEKVKETVSYALKVLKGIDFDAIACRGTSGLIIAPILAYFLDKQLIVVRKTKADSHASFKVEGLNPDPQEVQYIIVDDFISSGDTCRQIVSEIEECVNNHTLVGAYLYHEDWDIEKDDTNLVHPRGWMTAEELDFVYR